MMKLIDLLATLDRLAPLELAEDWDNVGLLLEPRDRTRARVKNLVMTIDLTRRVFDECVALKADTIISYHPPIFSGLRRLTRDRELSAIVLEAVRRGMAIYSPHTALDAAPGGVNDWLIGGLGVQSVTPLQGRSAHPGGQDTKLVIFVPRSHVDGLREALVQLGCGVIGDYTHCSFELEGEGTFRGGQGSRPFIGEAERLERAGEVRLEMVCSSGMLKNVSDVLDQHHPYEEPAWDALALRPRPLVNAGQGRLGTFSRPVTLKTLVRRIKKHLGLKQLRLATAPGHDSGSCIEHVAVCAGAGASVILDAPRADVLLTGEMRHHDILASLSRGRSVILCDHTNTERGFLPHFAERLKQEHPDLGVHVAVCDHDPLQIV